MASYNFKLRNGDCSWGNGCEISRFWSLVDVETSSPDWVLSLDDSSLPSTFAALPSAEWRIISGMRRVSSSDLFARISTFVAGLFSTLSAGKQIHPIHEKHDMTWNIASCDYIGSLEAKSRTSQHGNRSFLSMTKTARHKLHDLTRWASWEQ